MKNNGKEKTMKNNDKKEGRKMANNKGNGRGLEKIDRIGDL